MFFRIFSTITSISQKFLNVFSQDFLIFTRINMDRRFLQCFLWWFSNNSSRYSSRYFFMMHSCQCILWNILQRFFQKLLQEFSLGLLQQFTKKFLKKIACIFFSNFSKNFSINSSRSFSRVFFLIFAKISSKNEILGDWDCLRFIQIFFWGFFKKKILRNWDWD